MKHETTKAIERATEMNMEIRLSKDMGRLKVCLIKENSRMEQLLPMDAHVDYALGGCINFCVDKILGVK